MLFMAEGRRQLKREVGVFGAVFLGLGSILGSGVFVALGLGAGLAGPAVLLAIVAAGLLALCNGINSAQLAANHPTSGGTYAYASRWFGPRLGFTAGWLFLLAKSASAATAALAFGGYLNFMLGKQSHPAVPALIAIAGVTILILLGIRRTNLVNVAIVSVTILGLLAFMLPGFGIMLQGLAPVGNFKPFWGVEGSTEPLWPAMFEATALMFVAFTGYGRVATLGEEIRDPRKSIPIAIFATLAITMLLYLGVATVAIALVGADEFAAASVESVAPLLTIADFFNNLFPLADTIITIAALAAMLGVLLNLILGLSRVLFAMGREGDLPGFLGLTTEKSGPFAAILVIALFVASLLLLGTIERTWSLSAFPVLLYYAITNLTALRLAKAERLYSPVFAYLGLVGCVFFAFWVDPEIILWGCAIIVGGLGVQMVFRKKPTGAH